MVGKRYLAEPTNSVTASNLLVLSQVVLALQLPFVFVARSNVVAARLAELPG